MSNQSERPEPPTELPEEFVESLSNLLAQMLVNDYRAKHGVTSSNETLTPK